MNVSLSIDRDCYPHDSDADSIRMVIIVLMGTSVCATGIVLNSFLLSSMRQLPILSSNMLYFFLLACFDIAVEICFILIFVVSLLWDYYHIYFLFVLWHYYIIIISTVGQVLIACSTLLIVAASFERYFTSSGSCRTSFSKKQRCLVVGFVISMAFIMKGSVFIELELFKAPQCPDFTDLQLGLSSIVESDTYRTLWMFWGRSLLNVILPFSLLLMLNAATISNLNKSSKNLGELMEQLPSLIHASAEVASARRRKRDATRTLAALVSIYLITNTLNMLITILEFVDQKGLMNWHDGAVYRYASDISSLLTISSTAFRLPIYYHCNRDMRYQLKKTIGPCFPEKAKSQLV